MSTDGDGMVLLILNSVKRKLYSYIKRKGYREHFPLYAKNESSLTINQNQVKDGTVAVLSNSE